MPTTRRQFIKRGAGLVTLGVVMPRIWLSNAMAQSSDVHRRRFVVIQLAGGNDGFNTVIPYTDSRYHALRPILGFKEPDLKDSLDRSTIVSPQLGLHPSMSRIKDLYDQGRVAIVQGVGYPNPNLSHFLSMDIWHTADVSGLAREGWLGKYADLALIGQEGLPAAAIAGGELPKSFNAQHVVVPNIINFQLFNFITDPAYPGDHNNQLNTFNAAASRSFAGDTLLGAINRTSFESVRGAQIVQKSINSYQSSIRYPENNPLAIALKMAAQIMTTMPEASLMYVALNGFDHHSDQVSHPEGQANKLAGQHAILLNWFSEAVKLFYDDMTEHGLADDVVMMQWSEFGRRPGENASFGTDHGTVGSVFIIGNPVIGGIYGDHPSLAATELDPAGNPRFNVDFREIYATVLDRWLQADSRAILGAAYDHVGFIQ
jgi:uncharacterized protein (DUF1501 family)